MFGQQKPRVVHLIDDITAGGVTRVLDHLTKSTELAQDADHRVLQVKRGKASLRQIRADVIVSHLSISWRTLPALVALRARHPFSKIIHVEHSYTEGFVRHNVSNKRRFLTLLRQAFRLFNKVVSVSDGQAKWLTDEALVTKTKLAVIRSYVDVSPFETLPQPTGPIKHFGAIGRLDRQKGFDVLIQAFQQVARTDICLSIFGEGPEEANLRALAKDDPRICFEGFSASATAPYEKIDVVLMPSRWEAYGLVAIEALAAGRKLVCSRVDGLSDHAEIGAELLDGSDVKNWSRVIDDLSGKTSHRLTSKVRTTRSLECRFGWNDLLR